MLLFCSQTKLCTDAHAPHASLMWGSISLNPLLISNISPFQCWRTWPEVSARRSKAQPGSSSTQNGAGGSGKFFSRMNVEGARQIRDVWSFCRGNWWEKLSCFVLDPQTKRLVSVFLYYAQMPLHVWAFVFVVLIDGSHLFFVACVWEGQHTHKRGSIFFTHIIQTRLAHMPCRFYYLM